MSTYYATFRDWKRARSAANELVNGGVSPDDLSLVLCKVSDASRGEIREFAHTVGDATSFIGRTDDPARSPSLSGGSEISGLTSARTSRLNPVDTSNPGVDVDSVDQMDDSQNEAEFMISPGDGVSYSAHEKDDIALSLLTGFPTAPAPLDNDLRNPFAQGEQNADALEMIEIPGVGLVIGGGALATAALDFAKGQGQCDPEALRAQLLDEGVPQESASDYQAAFERGEALLAVIVTPGVLNEDAIEEVAERHGGANGALFDAPRY